ncbi:MAG TPA: cyclic nucleotide-binding domain-containing protein [Candidatus Limnocylindrales bacterium]|jgi:CRP-like cAMP-binding protein
MTTHDVRDQLKGTWFAADLGPGPLEHLASLGRPVDLPVGTIVVREGLPCDYLGVVISGRIALRLAVPGSPDRTILTVHEGDVFGWSAVLPRPIATSTGVAVAPTRAITFDGQALRAGLVEDRELAAALYERLLISVSRRLTATRVQMLDLYRAAASPW